MVENFTGNNQRAKDLVHLMRLKLSTSFLRVRKLSVAGMDAGANSERASNMVQYKEQKIKVLCFHFLMNKSSTRHREDKKYIGFRPNS